ncbi:MAG: hypothetical protein ACTSQI_04695 [Candidatus Helarchaeota archaeon]
MTTSIKVSDKSKRILDKLQAKITLLTEKKATLQEIIDNIIELINNNEALLINHMKNTNNPLEKQDIEKIMNFPWSFGVKTREEELDKILYGDEP